MPLNKETKNGRIKEHNDDWKNQSKIDNETTPQTNRLSKHW